MSGDPLECPKCGRLSLEEIGESREEVKKSKELGLGGTKYYRKYRNYKCVSCDHKKSVYVGKTKESHDPVFKETHSEEADWLTLLTIVGFFFLLLMMLTAGLIL